MLKVILLIVIAVVALLLVFPKIFMTIVVYRRRKSKETIVSLTYRGILNYYIGDSWNDTLEKMKSSGILTESDYLNSIKYRNESKKGSSEFLFSSVGNGEFKDWNFMFNNGSVCGIIMHFYDSSHRLFLLPEALKSLVDEISINNGKFEKTNDGRYIWTQRSPHRMIVLNTENKTLSLYDVESCQSYQS